MKIEQIDNSFVKVHTKDRELLLKIFNHFSYYVPGYQFMPLYKMGKFDGKIKLFDFIDRTLPIGLLYQLEEFLNDNDIEYELEQYEDDEFIISESFLDKFISKLKLPFEVRDYQKELVLQAINRRKMIGVAATSSGKSVSIYIIIMIMLYFKKRCFLIVPNISLVHQMRSDFISYGLSEEKANDLIHIIYGGQEKAFTKKIIITTWQSIHKPDILRKFTKDINFTEKQYDCVIIDETHLLKSGESKKLGEIVEAFKASTWKIGVTGSLQKDELDKQQTIACIGEPVNIIKASDLVQQGYATELDINTVVLNYSEEDKKKVRSKEIKSNWNKEIDFFNEHPKKLAFIKKLVLKQIEKKNNVVVFFKKIKYGNILYELFKDTVENLYYVDGSVDGKVRELIRKDIEEQRGSLAIVSFGTFSTGINIKLLNVGVFAEDPGKSDVTLIQSLGRFLRQHADKEKATLYDIIDNCKHKSFTNYSYKHFEQRLETYRNEGWFLTEHEVTFR